MNALKIESQKKIEIRAHLRLMQTLYSSLEAILLGLKFVNTHKSITLSSYLYFTKAFI